jgi:hypothetical protein
MATQRSDARTVGNAAIRKRSSKRSVPTPPPPATADRRKYTLRVDAEPAARFERAVIAESMKFGRMLDKSEVMRELLMLFTDDQVLAKKVVERLRRR